MLTRLYPGLLLLMAMLLALSFAVACGDDDDDNDSGDDDNDTGDDDQADDDAVDDDSAVDDDTACPDLDGDGFTDINCGGEDCNDNDSSIFPGAEDLCDDGIDQDCDNAADDGCLAWEVQVVQDNVPECPGMSWVGESYTCWSLAFTPTDQPVVAFYDGTNEDLMVAVFTAKGWDIETVDSENQTGVDPTVDVDSTGRIGVAFKNITSASNMVSLKSGEAWITSTLLSGGGEMMGPRNPKLIFDGSDTALVGAFKGGLAGVYLYTENGAEWDSEKLFVGGDTAYPYTTFDMALSADGKLGVVWDEWEEISGIDYTQIYFGVYDFADQEQHVMVRQAEDIGQDVAVAWTAANEPYVFWTTGGIVTIQSGTGSGTSWSISTVPDPYNQIGTPLSALSDTEGNIWLNYNSDFPPTPRLAAFDGAEWTFQDVLSEGQYGQGSSFALDSLNLPGVVYRDQSSGALMYGKLTGVPEVVPE